MPIAFGQCSPHATTAEVMALLQVWAAAAATNNTTVNGHPHNSDNRGANQELHLVTVRCWIGCSRSHTLLSPPLWPPLSKRICHPQHRSCCSCVDPRCKVLMAMRRR